MVIEDTQPQGHTPDPKVVSQPALKPGTAKIERTMPFGEALLYLCQSTGHRVRRMGWPDGPERLLMFEDELRIQKADGVHPCMLHRQDIVNSDWVACV